jgi:hypothetical protein
MADRGLKSPKEMCRTGAQQAEFKALQPSELKRWRASPEETPRLPADG